MKKLFFATSLFCMSILHGQKTIQNTQTGIRININNRLIGIDFYNEGTVRITKYPTSTVSPKQSLSVITKPMPTLFKTTYTPEFIRLKTKKITVSLEKATGRIFFSKTDNSPLLTEKAESSFTPISDAGTGSLEVRQSFLLDKDEAIYGLGQLQDGKMSQRNQRKHLVQCNLEDVIPFSR